MADAFLHHALHADPVPKADLELGRMDVDVHVLGRGLDAEEDRGSVAGVNGGAIPGFGGAHEEGILERPAVHEQLGAAARRLRVARALDEPADPERAGGVLHRDERARELTAPHRRQALLRAPDQAAPTAAWWRPPAS